MTEAQQYHNRPELWTHPGFRPPVTLAQRQRMRQFLIAEYGERFDPSGFDRLFGPPPNTPPPNTQKLKRKPSLSRTIKQIERSTGKPVTSATLPDGTKLAFGEPEPTAATNPWLADLKVTKQ